jgi:hypothetical protein
LLIFLSPAGRWQPTWLLVASYAFCASYGWKVLGALVALTAANFVLAAGGPGPGRGRWTLAAAVAVNSVPGVLQVAGSCCAMVSPPEASWASIDPAHGGAADRSIVLFAASRLYQIDLRRGQIPSPPGFVGLASTRVLLAARGSHRTRPPFLPQLTADRVLDANRLAVAVTPIVVGLVRKVLIGDPLSAMIPGAVFTSPENASALLAWLAVYTIALYNDFAGYTSIARGVSSLFGIDLSPNFASPLFARSFTEFWNRWHITLSQWLRDYVFLPGSRALLRRASPSRARSTWCFRRW